MMGGKGSGSDSDSDSDSDSGSDSDPDSDPDADAGHDLEVGSEVGRVLEVGSEVGLALEVGSEVGPEPHIGIMKIEMNYKLKNQFEVLGNDTLIDTEAIIRKTYQYKKPEIVTTSGKKVVTFPSAELESLDTKHLLDVSAKKYDRYKKLPHKTLVVGSFHSEFTLEKIIVPENVCICFTTPLMEFGIVGEDSMLYHNYADQELPKELFNTIFKYKQTLIDDKLQVEADEAIMRINYFHNSNWYYPGQICPSIDLYFDVEEVENEVFGVYEITDEFGKFQKNTSKIEDGRIDIESAYKLTEILKIFNTRPDHQYIFVLTGCRFMAPELFSTYNNSQIRDLKMLENITVNLNYELSKTYEEGLASKLETAKNTGIPALEDIFDINSDDLENSLLYNETDLDSQDLFKFYYGENYQHKFQSSRKNKIYLDILESIQEKKEISTPESYYLYYGPLIKTLRFIAKLLSDNSTDEAAPTGGDIANKIPEEQLEAIVERIFYTSTRKGDLLRKSFKILSNFYILLKDANLNLFTHANFQKKFIDKLLVANKLYVDIIMEFPNLDAMIGPHQIPYFYLFQNTHVYLDSTINKKLSTPLKKSLGAIHLINSTTASFEGIDFTEYEKLTKLKFSNSIELISKFAHLKPQLKSLDIDGFHYNASTTNSYELISQFNNLSHLSIEFVSIQGQLLTFNYPTLKSLELRFLKLTEPSTTLNVILSLPILEELNLNYENIEEDKIIFNSRIKNNQKKLILTGKNPNKFNLIRFVSPNLNYLELNFQKLRGDFLNHSLQFVISQSKNLKTLIVRNQGRSNTIIDVKLFKILNPISSVSGLKSVVLKNFELDIGPIIKHLEGNIIRYKLDVKSCSNYKEFKKRHKKSANIRKNINFKYIL